MNEKSRLIRSLLLAGVILTGTPSSLLAQAPDPKNYSEAKYEIHERRGVMVPMRDGVGLSVDTYSPASPGPLPAILSIWPYDNVNLRTDARWFAKRGYVVVVADSRGRYDSEGIWNPFDPKHKSDGYDLVEWIAQQHWSNGKVGMIGPSYAGWTQWWTASTAPPHLAAIAPKVAPPDPFENVPYQNGVLNGWIMNWAALMSGRTAQIIGDERGYGGWGAREEDLRQTPYSNVNVHRGMESAPWFKEWYRQNKATDPYWKDAAYQTPEQYAKIAVPSLSFTGWFDPQFPGAPMNYRGMKQHGATSQARRPSLIIGPWTHSLDPPANSGIDYGPAAILDINGYIVRWFDHFLKGIDNGVEKDPPVYVFVMGENKWHAEKDWPLPHARPTKFYFTSGGRANSLKGDGALVTTLPSREMSDSYVYDPRNPTRDPFGGAPVDGPCDTRLSAIGDDVLVYQSPQLESPIEVTGPIEATLYAATSAKDTDWFVRLIDVQPDGRALLLAEGAMRARNRDATQGGQFNAALLSKIKPGQLHKYKIRFWRGTANLFKPGHRIRVEISSSWYPYFLPNLNSGADNLAMVSISDAIVAHQTVTHGPRHPSHVLLPVVPPRARINRDAS